MNLLRGYPSIIVFLFYFACLWTSSVSICPMKCHCNDEDLRVNCSDADLDVIPITLNPDLRQFNLQNNHVKAIKLSFQVYHNLQYLDMSHNQLVSIGGGNFAKQRQLTVLLLSMNTISGLEMEAFKGLSSLQVLHLNANQLEEIEDDVFSPLNKLETLDISHNRIFKLSDLAFAGLPNLKTLLLRDNKLRNVPSNTLSRLPTLLSLDLGSNPFTDLPESSFDSMKELESLQLDQCSLDNLKPGSLKGLSSLLKLKLSDNKVDSVPTEAFSDTPHLEELSIGQNPFVEIQADSFKGLKYLKTVNVRGSKTLSAIRKGAFLENSNLEFLAVERNPELRVIETGVFDGLPNLRVVSLRGNALEYIDHSLLPWDELEFLDTRDNPLVCNCSLLWLRNFLLKFNSSNAGQYETANEDTSRVYCQKPDHLQGQLVVDLTSHDFNCELEFSREGVIIGIVVGVTLIVVVALAMVALFFREKIAGVLKTKWNGNRKEPQYQKTYGDEENNILQAAQHPLKNTPVTEL